MALAEELIVALRSENADEVEQDLDNVQSKTEETTSEIGDSADQMGAFSEKFGGAMTAIMAGFAIATAGLLAQVPLIGEHMSGIAAVLEALGLRLDRVGRALGLNSGFWFELSQSILEADGALGLAIDALLVAVTVIGTLSGLILGAVKVGAALASAYATISGVLSTVASAASGLVTSIASIVSGSIAAAAGLGVLIGTLGVAVLEVTGVLDAVRGLGQALGSGLPGWASDAITALLGLLSPLIILGGAILGFVRGTLEGGLEEGISQAVGTAQDLLDIFAGAWSRTLSRITDMAIAFASDVTSIAVQWGVNLVEGITEGVKSMLGILESVLEDFPFIGQILDLFDRLSNTLSEMDLSDSISTSINTNASGGGGGGASVFGRRGTGASGSSATYLDGRRMDDDLGRYRYDRNARRGNTG